MAALSSPAKNDAGTGILLSTLSPKYLHTNSTSHTWPFSAIAELIDNAYDPDVKASQLWMDKLHLRGKTCLSFTDNGNGMTPEKLHKMLSFGFCEKVADKGHMPVGHYGNGFKSGSMRLGKDALVLTKQENSRSVGYLSQTYLAAINAETVLVPIATWNSKPNIMLKSAGAKALLDILKHSVLKLEEEIMGEFDKIPGPHGTRIIISNIRRTAENWKKSEFDFSTDEHDIRIPDDANTEGGKFRQTKRQNHIPECDYSLKVMKQLPIIDNNMLTIRVGVLYQIYKVEPKAYCAILYLKPKMQIILRGKKVKTLVVERSLSQTEVDRYKPQMLASPVKVVFGFNSQNKNHYGIMMYHRNRLIKPYERVGHQLKANNLGVGVVGVVQCDFLQPTHNKQDFDYTKAYRACISSLGIKLNEYWNEKKGPARTISNSQVIPEPIQELKALPDQNWVQCDKPSCLKWRKLPDGVNPSSLPDKWYCHMNPDENYKSCDIPEEKDEDISNIQPYAKVQRKRLEKALLEKNQREKEAEKSWQLLQEQKKLQLKEKEDSLRQKEEHLNKQLAVLQSKTKVKVEEKSKLPTAQVLPTRPTMVKMMKPYNCSSPTANQLPSRVAQNIQSAHTPVRVNQSTPCTIVTSQSLPRSMVVSQSTQSPIKPSQSTPRLVQVCQSAPRVIVGSQSTPRSILSIKSAQRTILTPVSKPGRHLVKAGQSAPPAIRLVTKAAPGQLDSARLTFKVMKSPDGNTFLVQEKTIEKKPVVSSSPILSARATVAITAPKAATIVVSSTPGNVTNPRTPGVDVKPRLSIVLPKSAQTPVQSPNLARDQTAVNDRFCKIAPNGKTPLMNVLGQVKPPPVPSIPAASFPQLINAISTTVTSKAGEEKKGVAVGIKREHSDNVPCPVPEKSAKKVDEVIVIDSPPTQPSLDSRIAELEAVYKEKTNKLQSQINEQANDLKKKTNEIEQKTKELNEKSNALTEKTKQMNSLRGNVCKLLQVLVPEIDVDCEEGERETVDELLKQVLEANQ